MIDVAKARADTPATANVIHFKLVCLTQVSMANGAIHPAAEVGARARAAGAIYLLDACQAAGQLVLDVDQLGCDFLVFTGRKFLRGPRGTGLL